MNASRQSRILSLIDKLPGEKKQAARFFYEMLCDYVHPNVGAHTLVVDMAEPLGKRADALVLEPRAQFR